MDCSPNGRTVYVSDTGNGRIARWDLTGPVRPVWLAPFGGRCANHPQPCADPPADAGKFNHLRRVAVDPAGLVYGADFWGAGIEVFDPTRALVRSIEGVRAAGPGLRRGVRRGRRADDGHVYVMDRLNHRIQRFTAARRLRQQGRGPRHPAGHVLVARGARGRAERAGLGRRHPRRPDRAVPGRPRHPTAVKSLRRRPAAGAGQFNYPRTPTSAANGVVWVADTRNDRLQMRSTPRPRRPSRAVGDQGTGAGQFKNPMGVAVTADAVFVADTGNNRVQKLSLAGAQQATYATGLAGPQGLDVAPDGTVWVADTKNNRLVHLSADLANLGDGFGSAAPGTPSSSSRTTSPSATARCTSPTPTTTGSRSSATPRDPRRRGHGR